MHKVVVMQCNRFVIQASTLTLFKGGQKRTGLIRLQEREEETEAAEEEGEVCTSTHRDDLVH